MYTIQPDNIIVKPAEINVKNVFVKMPLTYDELLVNTGLTNKYNYVIVYDDFIQDANKEYILKSPDIFKKVLIGYSNKNIVIIKINDNTKINTYKTADNDYFYNLGDILYVDRKQTKIACKLKYQYEDNDNIQDYTKEPLEKEILIINADKITCEEGQFK